MPIPNTINDIITLTQPPIQHKWTVVYSINGTIMRNECQATNFKEAVDIALYDNYRGERLQGEVLGVSRLFDKNSELPKFDVKIENSGLVNDFWINVTVSCQCKDKVYSKLSRTTGDISDEVNKMIIVDMKLDLCKTLIKEGVL